ncbi:exosortase B [Sphaerotilus sp.]|uniref:exosortase B n=1 Tax=Sphaerotilus sp. TaxID=2093942 RepID=UPI00286E4B0C|nr:exosortase B [Sphaerotilus sp.]
MELTYTNKSGRTGHPNSTIGNFVPWLIAIAGLLAMYGPTFWDLFHGLWAGDQQGHGPIVLAISIWLLWQKRNELDTLPVQPKPIAGWSLLAFGLVLYLVGRSQNILIFEVGSIVFVTASMLLLLSGSSALKLMWFPLFFMAFMVPLPGLFVDALTQPMKMAVSYVAEFVLYHLGYPISRSGVILQIGQYQLLVADACAGLNTLFTLEALGLLYLNLVRHQSAMRNILLAIFIVPISFTANVIRVIVLTLITYHFGDAAGQGFLHGFAGMVLFLAALTLIIASDGLLRMIVPNRQPEY